MGEHREWLRTWVEKHTESKPLTPAATERALDIAEKAFRPGVGVGHAAQIGVDTVVGEVFKK